MGWKHISVVDSEISLKERVETCTQNVTEISSSPHDDVSKKIVKGKIEGKTMLKSYKDALTMNA